MSAAPYTFDESDRAWERALLDRQLERLDQLADMGMALAAEIQRRAITAAPAADITHAAIDFARISRAVRMTLALQSKLVRDFKTPIKAPSAKADNDEDVRWQVQWIDEDDPRKVRDSVRRVAEDAGLDVETVERLAAEAEERMERDDVYNDVYTRSFDEIVAQICKDLNLPMSASSPEERQRNGGGGPLKGVEGARHLFNVSAEDQEPPCAGTPPPPLCGSPPPQAGEDAGP